jgi:hypothetical protein
MTANTQQFAMEEWQQVPLCVEALLPAALALRTAHNKAASALGLLPLATVSWHPSSQRIVVHTRQEQSAYMKQAYVEKLGAACEIAFSTAPPTTGVLVKIAGPILRGIGNAWGAANSALGGPTPLSHAVVSGLALGGLGYGAGALAEQVIPERMLEQGKLRRTLGTIGLLGGAGIGALEAGTTAHKLDQGFWRSWLTSNLTPIPQNMSEKKANAFFSGVDHSNMTGLGAPVIKVDAFNRAVWADARTGYDQTGMVDRHTSPQIAAATTGIVSGIASQARSPIISPATVINGLTSAGVGIVTANIAGRTLGALAGLSPHAQEKIQDIGLWGGMLHTVIPPLFGQH